jgi:HSP20 family protein
MFGASGRNNRGLVRSNAYPILSLFDEMNRLFEDATPVARVVQGLSSFKPSLDLVESEKDYTLTGEFPGLEAADIQIELRDNSITLSGEKRENREVKDGERLHVERSYGSFSRTIQLGVEVDEDSTTAEMKNGVLTVRIPKSARAVKGARRVSIKTAGA